MPCTYIYCLLVLVVESLLEFVMFIKIILVYLYR